MKYLPFFVFLSLVSCSTYIRTVGSYMVSPETHGKFGKGLLEARTQGSQTHQVDFSGDRTNEPLNQIEGTYATTGNAELGLLKRLDVFIMPSLVMSPTIFGAKFQFLGDPKNEAKQGNFSASVMGGVGSSSENRKDGEGDSDIFDGNIDKIKSEMDHSNLGLIVGYRWHDRLLHYANGVIIDERFKGTVTNNDGTLTDAPFTYTNHGIVASTGVIYYFQVVHLKVDFSHMVTNWSNTRSITTNSFNLAFGFSW